MVYADHIQSGVESHAFQRNPCVYCLPRHRVRCARCENSIGMNMRKRDLNIRPFQTGDEEVVIELWKSCDLVRSWNDPEKDIFRKLQVRPDLFLVGLVGGRIVASVMAGYEGHRGWLNYLAVDPDFRGRGYARIILEEAERLLRASGCPKINLQIRTSNRGVIDFYRHMGYSVDETVSMGKRLEHDE